MLCMPGLKRPIARYDSLRTVIRVPAHISYSFRSTSPEIKVHPVSQYPDSENGDMLLKKIDLMYKQDPEGALELPNGEGYLGQASGPSMLGLRRNSHFEV